jgi:hypothetical protein
MYHMPRKETDSVRLFRGIDGVLHGQLDMTGLRRARQRAVIIYLIGAL